MKNRIYAVKLGVNGEKPKTFFPLDVVLLMGAFGLFVGIFIVIMALDTGMIYWKSKIASSMHCERSL